jgi:hypothetical protein
MAAAQASGDPNPNHAEELLDEVRDRIAPEDEVLKAARERRELVKTEAMKFRGTARAFNSGSVAHGTANNPVNDADGGVVLDRRHHLDLGPDGAGVGPTDTVNELVEAITPGIKETFPNATVETTKRAVLVQVNDPVGDEDPSVDLIVGLARKEDDALWIPHLDADRWDPSHPEEHTRLLTADAAELRVHRARVLRLAKAAVCNDGDKHVMCSFNIEALALEHILKPTLTLGESLEILFADAAVSIEKELTPDPAGVSAPIKLPEGITQETAARRLRFFAGQVRQAREAYSRAGALAALVEVFGPQLPSVPRPPKSSIADELRRGERGAATTGAFGAAAADLKPTRAFGRDS